MVLPSGRQATHYPVAFCDWQLLELRRDLGGICRFLGQQLCGCHVQRVGERVDSVKVHALMPGLHVDDRGSSKLDQIGKLGLGHLALLADAPDLSAEARVDGLHKSKCRATIG